MDIDASNNHNSESNNKNPSYIQIVRSIIGGASLGAIIGTPLGFVGSAVGAGIGSAVIPFLVLKKEDKADKQSSLEESNES
ncbi:MAG: hypothetical protein QNJ55_03355 [Xenococcus sp. MO_188.B8]|nr:hypothetical protein [Xenococcus sp. MO_188.B8]